MTRQYPQLNYKLIEYADYDGLALIGAIYKAMADEVDKQKILDLI